MTSLLKNIFSENYHMPKQTKLSSLVLKASFSCQSSLCSCAFSAASPPTEGLEPSLGVSLRVYVRIPGAMEPAGGLSAWEEADGTMIPFKKDWVFKNGDASIQFLTSPTCVFTTDVVGQWKKWSGPRVSSTETMSGLHECCPEYLMNI